MIEITAPAVDYFKKLLAQEEVPGMGLRLSILQPGTPNADCQLEFCAPGDELATDTAYDYDGFQLHVAANSEHWLVDAAIDFVTDDTGGQLTIKAPGLKGNIPGDDASLAEKVEWILEYKVNPQVASHGGSISLVEVTDAKEVVLRFGGGCQGCGMAHVTLKQGVEKTLFEFLPELTAVRDVTDHGAGANPYFE